MRLRSLSVAVLAAVLLVPASASAASAAESAPTVTATAKTYKSSQAKRLKRAARTAAVAPARPTGPVAPVAPVAPRVAPPVAPKVAPTVAPPAFADRVLALTNAERSRRGLRALSRSSCAAGFADAWAGRLSAAGTLSHQALSPIMRSCAARGAGENVAFGNVSPEQLVQMWMASAAHRANILNPAFTHLGVGEATTSSGRVYGVQVFLTA